MNQDFTTKAGLQAYVKESRMGHLCGYVLIPKGDVLHGVHYRDTVPIKHGEVLEGEAGNRGIVDIFCMAGIKPDEDTQLGYLFDVHGSVTWTGDSIEGIEGWLIGFDCAHDGDNPDTHGEEFVREECEFLARQVVEISNRLKDINESESANGTKEQAGTHH